MDKQQQMQLELNVLKERERNKKAVEKYSKKNPNPSLAEKENHAEYDWSSAINRNASKKSKKYADSIGKQRESKDDSGFVGTAKKVNPHRPLSLSLSDSEIGLHTKSNGMGLETMVSDVRDVLNSLATKEPGIRKSLKREGSSRVVDTSSASAREKFDKLNKIYQRVTGDKSIRSALDDDGSEDSDTHIP